MSSPNPESTCKEVGDIEDNNYASSDFMSWTVKSESLCEECEDPLLVQSSQSSYLLNNDQFDTLINTNKKRTLLHSNTRNSKKNKVSSPIKLQNFKIVSIDEVINAAPKDSNTDCELIESNQICSEISLESSSACDLEMRPDICVSVVNPFSDLNSDSIFVTQVKDQVLRPKLCNLINPELIGSTQGNSNCVKSTNLDHIQITPDVQSPVPESSINPTVIPELIDISSTQEHDTHCSSLDHPKIPTLTPVYDSKVPGAPIIGYLYLKTDLNGTENLQKLSQFITSDIIDDTTEQYKTEINIESQNSTDCIKNTTDKYFCEKCGNLDNSLHYFQHIYYHMSKNDIKNCNNVTYYCMFCDKNYKNWLTFRYHLLIHILLSSKILLICETCNVFIKNPLYFQQHVLKHNNPLKRYRFIIFCDKFINIDLIYKEIDSVITFEWLYCEKCCKIYIPPLAHSCKLEISLSIQISKNINISSYDTSYTEVECDFSKYLPCLFCNNYFNNHELLYNHLRNIHFYCGMCDSKFSLNYLLIQHFDNHKNKLIHKFLCSVCLKSINCGPEYDKHIKIHDSSNFIQKVSPYKEFVRPKGKLSCPYCLISVIRDNFMTHCSLQHDIKQCSKCGVIVKFQNESSCQGCFYLENMFIIKKEVLQAEVLI